MADADELECHGSGPSQGEGGWTVRDDRSAYFAARWRQMHPLAETTCTRCGVAFMPTRENQRRCDACRHPVCPTCGEPFDAHRHTAQTYCSMRCARIGVRSLATVARFVEWHGERFEIVEYVPGTERVDGRLTLRCRVCGETFERSGQSARRHKVIRCLRCRPRSRADPPDVDT